MGEIRGIPVGELHIDPMNVRSDPEVTKEFIDNLKSMDVIQPLIARPDEDGYGVVVGSRRYVGGAKAGFDTLPCEIRDVDDNKARELSLVENWFRKDLTKGDAEKSVYEAYKAGLEKGIYKSKMDMAKKTGITRKVIYEIVNRIEDEKELELVPTIKEKLSYKDFTLTRSLKDEPKLRKKVLEKRAEKKIRHQDLTEVSKILKESSEKAREEILSKDMVSPKQAKTISVMYSEKEEGETKKIRFGITHDFSPTLSRTIVSYASDIGKQPEEAIELLLEEILEAKGYGQ